MLIKHLWKVWDDGCELLSPQFLHRSSGLCLGVFLTKESLLKDKTQLSGRVCTERVVVEGERSWGGQRNPLSCLAQSLFSPPLPPIFFPTRLLSLCQSLSLSCRQRKPSAVGSVEVESWELLKVRPGKDLEMFQWIFRVRFVFPAGREDLEGFNKPFLW